MRGVHRYHIMLVLGILAISLVSSATAWARGTPAGTVIRNQAFGNYADANGNARPQTASNVVETTVMQVAAVDVSPAAAAQNVALGMNVNYPFTVENMGNGGDSFALTVNLAGPSAGWTTTFYRDTNSNGILDPAEAVPGNIVNNTGPLAADAMFHGILRVTPSGAASDGDQVAATVTATSDFDNTVSDSGVYTTTVNAAVVEANKANDNETPQPGEVVTYDVTVRNTGTETAYNVMITDNIPVNTGYEVGSISRSNDGGPFVLQDDDLLDDGIGFNGQSVVANIGNLASNGITVLRFRVRVNANVPAGVEIVNTATVNFEDAAGTAQPPVITPPSISTVEQVAGVDVTNVGPPALSGDPGDVLAYFFDLTNMGNGPDRFNLTTEGGFPNQVWVDANGNGIRDAGDYQPGDTDGDGIPDTGPLGQFQVIHLIVEVTIPVGAVDLELVVMTLTGTSRFNPNVSDADQATTTVTAPVLVLRKSVNPPTEVQVPPGGMLTYSVVVSNNGTGNATSVVIIDQSPANTTYVPGSVKVNNVAKTDAADADEVEASNGQITSSLGTMLPGSSRTIQFKVTVNSGG